MTDSVLVATSNGVLRVHPEDGRAWHVGSQIERPTALTADPWVAGRAWCATRRDGVFRTDDSGDTWINSGLAGQRLTALMASPARREWLWAGTQPSAVWRSEDAGSSWRPCSDPTVLQSSSEWSFPPKPETHHVRFITAHPAAADRLWVAIEAGALIRTHDGGTSWIDRVPGGPYDTHELAVHPDAPDVLHSAAGDGYYESRDGGETWTSPMDGFEVGYLRSVVIDPADPEVVVVSAASGPYSAYTASRSDGRLYRRQAGGRWRQVTAGWPVPPATIAPVLAPGTRDGELWAADERGVHRSTDGGATWHSIAPFDPMPRYVEGIAVFAR